MAHLIRLSSLFTLVGLLPHFLAYYVLGSPLWTDSIAEWIMARTPSRYAVAILEGLGTWAKPFAATGGLATLGAAVFLVMLLGRRGWWQALLTLPVAVGLGWVFEYGSWLGQVSFWAPVALALLLRGVRSAQPNRPPASPPSLGRRAFLGAVMSGGTVAVAVESYARNAALAGRGANTVELFSFIPPADREEFAQGLVRKAVTPVGQFYRMSKNTVDPLIDPYSWRLKITANGSVLREVTYEQLLSLPRTNRYVTLRCVSNTLQSDLMSTAYWTGIRPEQIIDRRALPSDIVEAAVIGIDGHGDSFAVDYLFLDEVLLAIGMNGRTLNRDHGFPVRLLVPRYYGFKNVKWISEIAFRNKPYFGTWPKMGYTKEPLIHTASHIDRIRRTDGALRVGGASFTGVRGVKAVQIRADQGRWVDAQLEAPLSPYTLTRWYGVIPTGEAQFVEARAQDGTGAWQATTEGAIFPDGMSGPTVRRVSS